MNRFKKLFVFFFILLIHWIDLYAQKELVPYMDYSRCLTGFKSNSGARIWEPEFEFVQPCSLHGFDPKDYTHWLVKHQSGLLGLLDEKGKMVIPFVYEELTSCRNELFIAKKEGRCGIIRADGSVVVAFLYEEIILTEYGYRLMKNGVLGIMDSNFKVLLEPQYQLISCSYLHSNMDARDTDSKMNFIITLNGKDGVFDRQTGLIIEPAYSWIKTCWKDDHIDGSVSGYIVHDSLRRSGLLTPTGELVVPFQKGDIEVFSWQLDSLGVNAVSYAIIHQIDGEFACHLNNKISSKRYDRLLPFGARLLYFEGTEWGVLDSNLRELARYERYPSNEELYHVYNQNHCYSTQYESTKYFRNGMLWSDDVMFTYKPQKKDIDKRYTEYKIGLVNYITNKSITPKYDQIWRRVADNKVYYWAFSEPKENNKEVVETKNDQRVDVYDERMRKIGSQHYFKLRYDHYSDYNSLHTKRLTVLENNEGYLGALSIDGELVIPFIYRSYSKINERTNFYVFGDFEKKGLFDGSGKEILPVEYEEINMFVDSTLYVTKDNVKSLYSFDLKVIIDSVSYFCVSEHLDRNGKALALNATRTEVNRPYVIVKNGLFYLYENGQLVKGDSTRFDFSNEYLLVGYRLSINKRGQVFYSDMTKPKDPVNTSKWIDTDPRSIPIVLYKKQQPSLYWVKEANFTNPKSTSWHLYDSLKKKVIHPIDFEFPIVSNSPISYIFKSNGLFGILSKDYTIAVPAVYEYIYITHIGYALLQNEKWQLYNGRDGFFSEAFDGIGTRWNKKGSFVFNENKVGMLNNQFKWVLPMTDTSELIKSANLLNFLEIKGLEIADEIYEYEGYVYNAIPENVYKKLNNRRVLEMNYERSTACQVLDFEIEPIPYNHFSSCRLETKRFSLRNKQLVQNRSVYCFSKHFYAEIIHKKTVYSSSSSDKDWKYAERTIRNYALKKDSLVVVELKDILQTDSQSMELLNELIKKEINRLQPFGLTCTNLEGIIETMKNDFILTKYGIMFPASEQYDFAVTVYFSDVKTILKEPWKFISVK
jgi:hypothetical protein